MFERFKRSRDDRAPARAGSVTTAERPGAVEDDRAGADRTPDYDRDPTLRDDRTGADRRFEHDRTAAERDERMGADRTLDDDAATRERTARRRDFDDRPATRAGNGIATRSALETARARQRDEFGGINWGASFFGWLVAVGVAALLTAILAAAGASIGLTEQDATANVEELTLAGGIALLVVLMLAYYAGGYVAGRMSRFDGGRQGLGTWVIGLIVTVALALAGVVLGSEYNVLEQLNLPALPVGDETLATGGLIALAAIVVGTLLAAMFGGKVGERYHKRVDRAGFVD